MLVDKGYFCTISISPYRSYKIFMAKASLSALCISDEAWGFYKSDGLRVLST